MIMKILFAAALAAASILESNVGFARDLAHAAGRGFTSAAIPQSDSQAALKSYGWNRGYYGGPDHRWIGGPGFFRGGGQD
jgi:NADPH-dependent 2,4-dienoyl-CoA reductase/sulfur reductase-like enzyme